MPIFPSILKCQVCEECYGNTLPGRNLLCLVKQNEYVEDQGLDCTILWVQTVFTYALYSTECIADATK